MSAKKQLDPDQERDIRSYVNGDGHRWMPDFGDLRALLAAHDYWRDLARGTVPNAPPQIPHDHTLAKTADSMSAALEIIDRAIDAATAEVERLTRAVQDNAAERLSMPVSAVPGVSARYRHDADQNALYVACGQLAALQDVRVDVARAERDDAPEEPCPYEGACPYSEDGLHYPDQPGDEIAEPRLPDGTRSRIHASCLGGDPVEPPPTNGGTPIALAA